VKEHPYLKTIVATCIVAIISFAAASHVSAWFGVDTVPVLQIVSGTLGGELILSVVVLIAKRPNQKKDKEK